MWRLTDEQRQRRIYYAKRFEKELKESFDLGDYFHVVPVGVRGYELYFDFNDKDSYGYDFDITDDEIEKKAKDVYDDLYNEAESIGMYGHEICRGDVTNGDGFPAIVIQFQ